jgi:hypothetical protein
LEGATSRTPRLFHSWRVCAGALALLAVFCAAALETARAADAIPLTATPVALDPNDATRLAVGRLIYRGGLILESRDARFGGWSDLRVDPRAQRLTAISDHGFWLQATLVHAADGRLTSLADARLGPLIDPAGERVQGRLADSEGLAARPDGGFDVSFERQHRIWAYPPADPPFSKPPQPVPTPARLVTAPSNGGIEALTSLSDGSLMTLVEDLKDGDENVGWIGDAAGRAWHELHYRAAPDFKPTALAEVPAGATFAGDVLVLERRFTFLDGAGARIVRVPRADIRDGAHLQGEVLAQIQPPLTIDNFEGLSAVPGPNGTLRLYIISDDNYTVLQRTLLLMFDLAPAQ